MTTKSKAETFIGFAVRSGKLRTGVNTLSTLKKAYLILVSVDAAEETLKTAVKYAERYRCKAFKTKDKPLEEYLFKAGIKMAAVTDFSLAKAIIENAGTEFTVI